jgi:hypothetical protein
MLARAFCGFRNPVKAGRKKCDVSIAFFHFTASDNVA